MHEDWTDKVVAITGGNSGIGRAVAHHLAAQGASIAILGRDGETVRATADELPGTLATVGDVTDATSLDRWYAAIGDRWGRLDTLVVNASIGHLAPLELLREGDLRASLDVNVLGAHLTVQRALPLLRAGSTVVFTTSLNAELASPGSSIYAATKAAQATMLRVFAAELAPRGIRVNGVRPGPVDTPMWERLGWPAEDLRQVVDAMTAAIPLGRFATPHEVALAIAFLAGPSSSFIVGQELTVDGGLALR